MGSDGSADGRGVDGPAREAGPANDAALRIDRFDARLGGDTRRDALGAGDGARWVADAGLAPADGPEPSAPDSAVEVDAPIDVLPRLADAAADLAREAARDRAVDAPSVPRDVGTPGSPDLARDLAISPDGDAALPTLACKVPDCWANLMRDCQPTGTCTAQSAEGREGLCFADSAKVFTAFDEAAGRMITTVTKAGQTCYRLEWDLAAGAISGATSTAVIKDGSGATVATIADHASGYSAITCTGSQPVVLTEGCDFVGPVVCESGVCNP